MRKFGLAYGCLLLNLLLPIDRAQAGYIGGSQISPSTSLSVDHPYELAQLADGITTDGYPYNGFASWDSSGTITLDLDNAYDLDGFILWNDVNVTGEGIAHFRLDFFGVGNSLLGSAGVFLAPQYQVEPETFGFGPIHGVRRVDLVVIDSNQGPAFNRIEIRELGFTTVAVPEPSSILLAATGGFVLLLAGHRRGLTRRIAS